MAKTEVEEVLGAPINPELSEYAQKLRRNLLTFSAVYVFCWLTGVKLDPTSAFFGIKLIGLNEQQFSIGTMIINAYLLIHFGWYAWEAVMEWRIRLTGTKVAFQTGSTFGSEAADYPGEPRQSNLYFWWVGTEKRLQRTKSAVDDFQVRLKAIENELVEQNEHSPTVDRSGLIRNIGQVPSGLAEIRAHFDAIDRALNIGRVQESLKRFDGWFKLMLKSQNLRTISVDIALPLLTGIAATGLNAFSLFCQ
ncbi:conserved membrane hypothetical protein [Limnobacter sp. 130]|uniref:hypothetical protein n=1 Tax=Limnobacter sp. 130 TaxID=2653147 RepID=UPI0012EF9D12|nr:hypothetical protein [Limnobacter sp. 130]VWX32815.1 conserved membrane hypothetical protein [Limnobacter sp. 130]